MSKENKTIMLFGDVHLPYHHEDAIDFLEAVKKKYKPTRVICMGDLIDNHAISYHETNPDLHSPLDELNLAITYMEDLYDLFPKLDILHGNHDKLPIRKSRTAGLPSRYIRNNHEVFGMPKGWKWYLEMNLTLPTGKNLWLRHNLKTSAIEVAKFHNTCFAQGHYHERFECIWEMTTNQDVFGITTGCLVDDKSLAMEYNKVNLRRPQLGCVIIKNGLPKLVPMELDGDNKWTRQLKN